MCQNKILGDIPRGLRYPWDVSLVDLSILSRKTLYELASLKYCYNAQCPLVLVPLFAFHSSALLLNCSMRDLAKGFFSRRSLKKKETSPSFKMHSDFMIRSRISVSDSSCAWVHDSLGHFIELRNLLPYQPHQNSSRARAIRRRSRSGWPRGPRSRSSCSRC